VLVPAAECSVQWGMNTPDSQATISIILQNAGRWILGLDPIIPTLDKHGPEAISGQDNKIYSLPNLGHEPSNVVRWKMGVSATLAQ
jgi:hypothetical protein